MDDSEKQARIVSLTRQLQQAVRENRMSAYAPYSWQKDFHEAGIDHPERMLMAANRVGKALRNGTKVATPDGWRAIETLAIGDKVIAGDGSVTIVSGVYPQGVKPLYRLTFDCGEQIDCCGEHLWLYQPPRGRYPYRRSHRKTEANPFYGEWRVSDTATLLAEIGDAPAPRMRAVMPTSRPWQMTPRPIPLDPYALGLLIGDGGLKQTVGFTSADKELIEALQSCLPVGVVFRQRSKYDWSISAPGGHGHGGRPNAIREALSMLGLLGCGSAEKRVPDLYKFNASEVRLAILQGLMDTDGSITRTGAMEFSSVSADLAEDVRFLVHTLGGKAKIERRQTYFAHKGERRAGLPSYRVRIRLNLCPFRLRRKAERWNPRHNTPNRVLHSIERAPEGLATCISVMHPDRTFVIEHGIVTHNTQTAGAEVALHLTGDYDQLPRTMRYPDLLANGEKHPQAGQLIWPDGWKGKRFNFPVVAWTGSPTTETSRDIVQKELLGNLGQDYGTGWVPKSRILGVPTQRQAGVRGVVDTFKVKHASGGVSICMMKAYEQGWQKWQGAAPHVVWLDEEPNDYMIYSEAQTRIISSGGIILVTFTPLLGQTELVEHFLTGGPGIYMRGATWDDAPHLPSEERKRLAMSYRVHEREARTKGVPMLGEGAVFPVADEDIRVEPFRIPPHFARIKGCDFGIDHPAAGVEIAWDRDQDVIYVIDCYRKAGETAAYHAAWFNKANKGIPVSWPHDGMNREKSGGDRIAQSYRAHGVNMLSKSARYPKAPGETAEKGGGQPVEPIVDEILERMMTGRFKVFSNLDPWFEEKRSYHRKDGMIVPKRDDILKATFYACMMKRYAVAPDSFRDRLSTAPTTSIASARL